MKKLEDISDSEPNAEAKRRLRVAIDARKKLDDRRAETAAPSTPEAP